MLYCYDNWLDFCDNFIIIYKNISLLLIYKVKRSKRLTYRKDTLLVAVIRCLFVLFIKNKNDRCEKKIWNFKERLI